MALIDVRCTAGHETEVHRPVADWPATPPCPTCGAATEQYHPPPRARVSPDPVVVFYDPASKSYRFPGDPSGAYAARCAAEGMQRIELRGFADVRRFETQMNRHEYSRAMRRVERQQQFREEREKHLRSELRSRMASMSERGRNLARQAMRMNDAKPRERAREAGFHVEVYSLDRSSRMESRDPHGRRRRD